MSKSGPHRPVANEGAKPIDYGHDLLFGTFITPVAQRPQHAVERAMVADRAGLDLVTFQDHPYQPGFLDTWTLLTYVAARTSRVRLSHNVLNLPLDPGNLFRDNFNIAPAATAPLTAMRT